MPAYTLFRDDDISYTSNINLLMETHELFLKHDRQHLVTVQMYRLWENKEVWFWLMTAKNLAVGLHGWEHDDYSLMPEHNAAEQIKKSLDYWQTVSARGGYQAPPITTFYPPWNHVSHTLDVAVRKCGLLLDSRWRAPVYGFHYWELIDPARREALEKALRS